MNNKNIKKLILFLVAIVAMSLLSSCGGEWTEYDSKSQKDMSEYRQIIDPMCEENGYTIKERNSHNNLYYCSAANDEGINIQITIYVDDKGSEDIGIFVICSDVNDEEIANLIRGSYSLVIPLINMFSETNVDSDTIDSFIKDSSNQVEFSEEENLLVNKHKDKGDFYLDYKLYCEDGNASDECINNHSITEVLYIATKYDEY